MKVFPHGNVQTGWDSHILYVMRNESCFSGLGWLGLEAEYSSVLINKFSIAWIYTSIHPYVLGFVAFNLYLGLLCKVGVMYGEIKRKIVPLLS
jgi:hypothetical protein